MMAKFSIESSLKEAPERVVVYGPGGVGKSTFAAQAECVFISAEDGLRNIDARVVKPYPETWQDILDAIDELTASNVDGIAIDSLDWAEPLCWRHACQQAKKPNIEAFGYGKGYLAALDQWRVLLHKLGSAHDAGKRVILIAHGVRRTFKNPVGEDYEHWTIKLHEKAAGLIVEWCDLVGLAEQDSSTVETGQSGRFKAFTTGKRVLRTNPNPAYLAKTRYALPKTLPLDYPTVARAIKAGSGAAAIERLQAELATKLAELANDGVARGCDSFLRDRGISVPSLNEAIGTVDEYLDEKRKAG